MLNTSRIALLALACAGLPCLSSASTINVSFGGTPAGSAGVTSSQAGATVVNFDNGTAPSNYTLGQTAGVVDGNQTNVYLEPTGDTTDYLTTGTSTVNINLASMPATYFGMYWGSVDTYNTISFREANGTVDTYTGAQIAALDGINPNGTTSAYVNFSDIGSSFVNISLSSTTDAFETDNHAFIAASATPEPASWLLMAGGLSAAALFFQRKQKQARG